ncbi:MAG: ArsR family transcriptional regulator [Marinifilaceae bacterium]|jgi:DNA-binding transcriptional ArsR family regulator|nr:ArsR family transcriptional regulator [Marinilabiliaceae bacterium JC040]MCT4600344.1 ArsR family transcriptional regulator [Marinifilaceae bacterium]
MKLDIEKQEIVARYAKALSNPIRVQILYFLASQEVCFFNDIFNALPLAKATVSQHLNELKKVGLIHGESSGIKTRYYIDCACWVEAKTLFKQLFSDCNSISCKQDEISKDNLTYIK